MELVKSIQRVKANKYRHLKNKTTWKSPVFYQKIVDSRVSEKTINTQL
jgi:hypothetical protein